MRVATRVEDGQCADDYLFRNRSAESSPIRLAYDRIIEILASIYARAILQQR